MKIAYLAESVIPSRAANSIHVMHMCEALAECGHEVTLFVPHRKDEQEKGVVDIYAFYGVRAEFVIRHLAWPRMPYRWAVASLHFALLAGRRRFDLILSRFPYAMLLPALSGNRVVFESHAPIWQASRPLSWAIQRLIGSGRIERLVVITESLRREYMKKGFIPANSVIVLPDAAPEPRDLDTKASPWPGRTEALQAGYVGQLYLGKGMEVVARLAQDMPEVDFHIVGGFDEDIKAWKKTFPLENLHFHGFIPHFSLSPFINRLDVCLLPNQLAVRTYGKGSASQDIGRYTSPLKMFEYMAHGKAILSSDLEVLREVLHPGIARFALPDDLGAWQEALRELGDPELRNQLGKAARKEFLERYTWKQRARHFLATLEARRERAMARVEA